MTEISYLPLWKKDSTPEEWCMELAMIARKHPERFQRAIISYVEDTEDGTILRMAIRNATTHEALGIMSEAAHKLITE